jgi:hypothetical protein
VAGTQLAGPFAQEFPSVPVGKSKTLDIDVLVKAELLGMMLKYRATEKKSRLSHEL